MLPAPTVSDRAQKQLDPALPRIAAGSGMGWSPTELRRRMTECRYYEALHETCVGRTPMKAEQPLTIAPRFQRMISRVNRCYDGPCGVSRPR
jgi:hypothetical protein